MEVTPTKRQGINAGGLWTSRTANGVTTSMVRVPYWSLLFATALCALFFAKGRAGFSLRTALIATVAFALLLGLHVGLQRAFD